MTAAIKFLKGEDGTTAVEYAVMLALIIGLCIGAITNLGAGGSGMWGSNLTKLQSAGF